MKCPYCNNEMEKGYIDQTDFRFPLEWYTSKRETGFFQKNKSKIKLTSLTENAITAYRCAECRKIIIDENLIKV